MMKKGIFLLLALLFLVAACVPKPHGEVIQTKIVPNAPPPADPAALPPVPAADSPVLPMANLTCSDNSDCPGKLCIDATCKSVQELYSTNCSTKCHFEEATLSTSDGETYTLKPGQGSYSYAGAMEWKVHALPAYCADSSVPVLIDILKKNTGRVLSTEVITLQQGHTSSVIRHPTIGRIAFTVTLDGVKQECA